MIRDGVIVEVRVRWEGRRGGRKEGGKEGSGLGLREFEICAVVDVQS